MASVGPYESQLKSVREAISRALPIAIPNTIHQAQVFQSRSGSPTQPWLEPDISDEMRRVSNQFGIKAFIAVPIGFISDHIEVIYDLDTLARSTAKEIGADFIRIPTPSSNSTFVELVADLVQEQIDPKFVAPTVSGMPPPVFRCENNCCIRAV